MGRFKRRELQALATKYEIADFFIKDVLQRTGPCNVHRVDGKVCLKDPTQPEPAHPFCLPQPEFVKQVDLTRNQWGNFRREYSIGSYPLCMEELRVLKEVAETFEESTMGAATQKFRVLCDTHNEFQLSSRSNILVRNFEQNLKTLLQNHVLYSRDGQLFWNGNMVMAYDDEDTYVTLIHVLSYLGQEEGKQFQCDAHKFGFKVSGILADEHIHFPPIALACLHEGQKPLSQEDAHMKGVENIGELFDRYLALLQRQQTNMEKVEFLLSMLSQEDAHRKRVENIGEGFDRYLALLESYQTTMGRHQTNMEEVGSLLSMLSQEDAHRKGVENIGELFDRYLALLERQQTNMEKVESLLSMLSQEDAHRKRVENIGERFDRYLALLESYQTTMGRHQTNMEEVGSLLSMLSQEDALRKGVEKNGKRLDRYLDLLERDQSLLEERMTFDSEAANDKELVQMGKRIDRQQDTLQRKIAECRARRVILERDSEIAYQRIQILEQNYHAAIAWRDENWAAVQEAKKLLRLAHGSVG